MPGSFLDTNVLVYLASGDAAKADRIEALLASGCTISVQVLNEIANVARRKMRLGWEETHDFLGMVRALTTVEPVGIETHDEGLRLAARYTLSIYDGMIVGAALLAGCETLWSEDMQDGLRIDDRLLIRNPFAIEQ
jgi:predicted nucleic acid-binding protein